MHNKSMYQGEKQAKLISIGLLLIHGHAQLWSEFITPDNLKCRLQPVNELLHYII